MSSGTVVEMELAQGDNTFLPLFSMHSLHSIHGLLILERVYKG